MSAIMDLSRFKHLTRVRYVPYHAYGDKYHIDCEDGKVSYHNESFVFVKFDKRVVRNGWDGATAEACDPDTLVIL
jgi:hypothetical protein